MKIERKRSKKRLKIAGIMLLVLFAAGAVYWYRLYHSLEIAANGMHQPLDRKQSDKRVKDVTLEKKEPFSILILGVDEREGDRGRSDSIIVLTVNPNRDSVKMLSIPRDTRTEIVGKGYDDKINHAYAFGGVVMAIDTVENFLDMPIDYYVQINMEGFKDIVDAVGGVSVTNDLDFEYEGVHFAKGTLKLNGEDALKYSRMRYDDPRGDFGRQARQRAVLQGLIKEGASVSSLANYNEIFGALSKNIRTNLTFEEMIDIQKNYKQAGTNIEQLQISGIGQKINKIYYFLIPENEKQRIQTELKDHLEI